MNPARFGAGWTIVALLFGLLLWAKLILVTGHPRTATAQPDPREISTSRAPDAQQPSDRRHAAVESPQDDQ